MNDVKRYGVGPAQMNSIINGVRKYIRGITVGSHRMMNLFLFHHLKETDLAMSGLMSSHSRYQKCDFSTPTMIESFKLVVPYPKEESRLLAPIRPFQPMVSRLYKLRVGTLNVISNLSLWLMHYLHFRFGLR